MPIAIRTALRAVPSLLALWLVASACGTSSIVIDTSADGGTTGAPDDEWPGPDAGLEDELDTDAGEPIEGEDEPIDGEDEPVDPVEDVDAGSAEEDTGLDDGGADPAEGDAGLDDVDAGVYEEEDPVDEPEPDVGQDAGSDDDEETDEPGTGPGGTDGGTGATPPDAPQPDAGETTAGACRKSAPTPAAYTGVNRNPAFLQVYVNNIENLETPGDYCPGDWRDLFHYMQLGPSPDVFLVQQISGQAQLDYLVKYMTDKLPGSFKGIIAEQHPARMTSPCHAPKAYQTNAIIYRTGRLEPVGGKHVWQSYAKLGGTCRRNTQARTKNVMQKFRDRISGKYVTVASLHWATNQGSSPDPACAEKNAAETAAKVRMSGYGGHMLVFGGDMNEGDRSSSNAYKPWYQRTNGDLGGAHGFRDAVYALCAPTPRVKACLADNWTVGSGSRIDFLFARLGNGCKPVVTRPHTITFEEADAAARRVAGGDDPANYSDHRAIRAQLHY